MIICLIINPPQFKIITQNIILKEIVLKTHHELILKSRPLILSIKTSTHGIFSSHILILKNETQLSSSSYSLT